MRAIRMIDLTFLILWVLGNWYLAYHLETMKAEAEIYFWISTVVLGVYFLISFMIKRFLLRKDYGDEFDI